MTPYLRHLAHELVAHGHRKGDRVPGPLIPVVDVDVGPANSGLVYPDLYVVGARYRFWQVFHPDADLGLRLYEGLHAITCISRPTFVNASIALSICSGVCAADNWVLMRAFPIGTTG
jgi:hypothetical protein